MNKPINNELSKLDDYPTCGDESAAAILFSKSLMLFISLTYFKLGALLVGL